MSMENFEFCLSSKCVKDLPLEKYEKDFTFIVDGKRYQTNRIIADLLSPRICKLHYIDPSFNEFVIDNKTINDINSTKNDYFEDFLSLSTFENITIDPNRQKYFQHYFYTLGSIDEYFQLQPDYLHTLNIDNIIERIQSFTKTKIEFNENINPSSLIFDKMIQFTSEHFEEIDKEKIKSLPNEIIEEIIKNENLKLKEEDSLLDFIFNLCEIDQSYSNLFEYVLFSNLSEEKLEKFINNFNVEYINDKIFHSICKRFFSNKNNEKFNENRYINQNNIKEFMPKENEDFDGILRYLTNKTGGNIHDNGTVEISSNSIYNNNNSYHPKNIVNYQNNEIYLSNDDGDAFVCIDFKERSFQISSYSIQSRNENSNNVHLKNWIIEVSENGKNWEEIDRHSDDSTLNGSSIKHRFNIKNPRSKFYKFIRLHQTGNSWYSHGKHNYIGFTLFEIYGELQEPKST